jgi:hypothetical protein
MSSVPERRAIDRTKPPYKDDPVVAALTDEQFWSFAELMARLATSYANRYEAAGGTVADLKAGLSLCDVQARAETKS